MLTAYNFNKANAVISEAQRILKQEMPNAVFVLVGVDNDFVHFNAVCKSHLTNDQEIRDIKAKTRFIPVKESTLPVYIGNFKIQINL